MKRLVLLFVCLVPSLVIAGSLHRCVSRSGHVSYLATRCPQDQRTERTIEYVAEPASRPSTVRRSERASEVDAGARGSRARGAGGLAMVKASPCMKAKAKRERDLQRLGLRRTFDDLSRMDGAVRAMCDGF